jgi:outer membrane protein
MDRVVWAPVFFGVSIIAFVPSAQGAPDMETMTLERAVQIAQERTADVIVARQDVVLADIQQIAALAPILPSFDLSSSAGENFAGSPISEIRSTNVLAFLQTLPTITYGPIRDYRVNSYSAPAFNVKLSASQLLFDGGRWWTVIAQADDVSAQADAALRLVKNDVRQAAARAFYTLEKTSRSVTTFESQVKLDEEQLDRVKGLMRAGTGKPADVAAVERNVAGDRAELAKRALAERQARRSLNLALGRKADTPVRLELPPALASEGPLGDIEPPSREKVLDLTLVHHPSLAKVRAMLEIDRKNVAIARADYFPVVTLGATYARQSRRPDRVYAADPTTDYYAGLSLGLAWNLFNGRATTANVQKMQVQLAKDEAIYDATERSVVGDVDDKLETVKTTAEVYALLLDTIRAAEEAVRLAKGNYEQGRGTQLELRDAQVQLTVARLNADAARLDFEIAREDLRHAVGVDPFGEDAMQEGK